MAAPTSAIQVNPFHDTIDLKTEGGKKLYQKAIEGLPKDDHYKGESNYIISFVQNIASCGEDFGWNSICENIGPNNYNLFKEPGRLTADIVKAHCDPKWADGTNADNVQFCIKSNMMYIFIKKSVSKNVLDDIEEEKHKWTRPGGGDGLTLLMCIYNKNAHGTKASAIIAKSELLEVNTKNFNHNINDVNSFFTLKNKEIGFSGEVNPECLYQLFKAYETCPVPKFQETISDYKRRWNRGDATVTKEALMAEAATTCDALVLEKKWITEDPKIVAFTNFIAKAEEIFQNMNSEKSKYKENKRQPPSAWKMIAPKDGEPVKKEVNKKTYYWCQHEHYDGKPMWTLHKPEDHGKPKKKPSNLDTAPKLELNDEMRSLFSATKMDFI